MKNSTKTPMSITRKRYIMKLIGRCLTLIGCALLWVFHRQSFDVIEGMNFFKNFSILHVLWLIWCLDMFLQIIPIKNTVALGSQKLFASHFRPIKEKVNKESLKNYIRTTTIAAYKVFVLWILLIAAIGVVYYLGFIDKTALFFITVLFYICDLICVLIWCPFRLMMKTKCCTTCRIFNWDHFMMFSPMVFAGGFYALSLVILSVIALIVWELCVVIYPERFWEMTNVSLKCSECTDKLCTQYCQKLRK